MRSCILIITLCITASYASAADHRQSHGPKRVDDRATGERYAGRRLQLPEFPWSTTVRRDGQEILLRAETAFEPAHASPGWATTQASTGTGAYLVISPQAWRDSLALLIGGRRALGYDTRWLSIEAVHLAYADVADPAERLKQAVSDAYSAGVRWALLVGDARILPVRYAADERLNTRPSIDQLQICDLYFGEFDGRWDLDGDGVFGEPVDDSADLAAEVYIGRLPVRSATEAASWCRKWDRYVFARGDTRYLGRALGLCSDQMRDFEAGAGQAAAVARAWPSSLERDSLSLLEWPTGDAQQPERPTAADIMARWNDGWGIVHIYAHGRWDGFALKTSAYNDWPKSYLLTDPAATSPHDWMGHTVGPAGIVYSVACNQAAFDQDEAFGAASDQRCVATQLLGQPESGAVVFIGYSRWGWVYSSYRVAESFWEAVFDWELTVAEALQYARLQHPYLLDVAYGHNVYGDPALTVWAGQPPALQVDLPEWLAADQRELVIQITSPVGNSDVQVTLLSSTGELLDLGTFDAGGTCRLPVPAGDPGTEWLVTVSAPGWAPRQQVMRVGIESGITGEGSAIPAGLLPSPNPFNASTRLTWTRTHSDRRLEVFNALGQRVRQVFLDGGTGTGDWRWNGRDDRGLALPSGVYFVRLDRGSRALVQRLLMLQ